MERFLGLTEETGKINQMDDVRDARTLLEYFTLDLPLSLAALPPYRGRIPL